MAGQKLRCPLYVLLPFMSFLYVLHVLPRQRKNRRLLRSAASSETPKMAPSGGRFFCNRRCLAPLAAWHLCACHLFLYNLPRLQGTRTLAEKVGITYLAKIILKRNKGDVAI